MQLPTRTRDHLLRRGVAVVELALLMPILATVVFGAIECCSVIRLKQRLSIMAYESARIAVLVDSNLSVVQQQCELLSDDDGLTGSSVVLEPSNLQDLQSGQWLTATVSLPLKENTAIGGWFFPTDTISESVSIQLP